MNDHQYPMVERYIPGCRSGVCVCVCVCVCFVCMCLCFNTCTYFNPY